MIGTSNSKLTLHKPNYYEPKRMQSVLARSQRDQASQIRSERFHYLLWFVDKEKSMAYIFFSCEREKHGIHFFSCVVCNGLF